MDKQGNQGDHYTEDQKNALMNLMIDCDRYGFHKETEIMKYVTDRFGYISHDTLYKYKKFALIRADYTDEWLNYFGRAGFAINHHKLMLGMQEALADTENIMRLEKQKIGRDEQFIMKLKYLHMEQVASFKKLADQTPLTAELFEIFRKYRKSHPDEAEAEDNSQAAKDILTKDVQDRGPDKITPKKFQLFGQH